MHEHHITALDVLTHTPLWVWLLLAYTLFIGWRMGRDRKAAPWRLFIMPAIAVTLVTVNLVIGATDALHLLGFAIGAAIGGVAGMAIARRRPAQLLDDGKLALKGDWLPLLLLVGIFAIRYAQGIALGINPALASNTAFSLAGMVATGPVCGDDGRTRPRPAAGGGISPPGSRGSSQRAR